MALRDRIGVDVGAQMSIEESVKWAAENDIHYVDISLEGQALDPEKYSKREATLIKKICKENDIHVGLHTFSSVNVAETALYVSEGVDNYLRAYIDIGAKVGAERIIVHGGYYFADDAIITQNQLDSDERIRTSKERLKRMRKYSERKGPKLLLENHNHEPPDSELNYVPVTLEECESYFSYLQSDNFGWAFNPPHARLFPEGIEGYLNHLGVDLVGQVRLNDNNGEVEEHLLPGEGTMDFEGLFELLESNGYDGHYMLKFGTLDEMLEGREYLHDCYVG
jgi:sugar phosphate isomerase/epimerase